MVVQFFHIYLFISMYNKNQSFGIALCTKKVVPVFLFFLFCALYCMFYAGVRVGL